MKILLIRFSSFGDVLQTLSVAGRLAEASPEAEIHWVTREDFAPLIETHPRVTRVWKVPRAAGLGELWSHAKRLRDERFTHVYDVHNNLRSRVVCFGINGLLGWRRRWRGQKFLRRTLYRSRRFLLFKFRINLYPKPFPGQFALLEPLRRWGLEPKLPPPPQLFLRPPAHSIELPFTDFVTLAPSAAFPLKRWPLEHFAALVRRCPKVNFVALGGPEDGFIEDLVAIDPKRVVNLAGRLSLDESAVVVTRSKALVANDTGLMHVAEQTGIACIALMGPAPFGYPARPRTRVLERDLPCRPCSKHGQGPCVNPEFQACLRTISPEEVARELEVILGA